MKAVLLGVSELLIVTPEGRAVELLRSVGGQLSPVSPEANGAWRSQVLGVAFRTTPGGLELNWPEGSATI